MCECWGIIQKRSNETSHSSIRMMFCPDFHASSYFLDKPYSWRGPVSSLSCNSCSRLLTDFRICLFWVCASAWCASMLKYQSVGVGGRCGLAGVGLLQLGAGSGSWYRPFRTLPQSVFLPYTRNLRPTHLNPRP